MSRVVIMHGRASVKRKRRRVLERLPGVGCNQMGRVIMVVGGVKAAIVMPLMVLSRAMMFDRASADIANAREFLKHEEKSQIQEPLSEKLLAHRIKSRHVTKICVSSKKSRVTSRHESCQI